MMPRTRKGSDGLAMIMVLVMIIIFASLILAVVISSTTAIRRAHYYKDKTTALEVAKAGLQDALYWMNYAGYYTQQYPCTDPSTTLYDGTYQYFQGSDAGSDTWITTEPANYNPVGVQGARCVVQFSDEDETDTANLDMITSTGYYKGRTATVSVRIRGQNGRGNPVHNNPLTKPRWLCDWGYNKDINNNSPCVATWGIPEDFNKHTVFTAKNVTAGTPATVTITGNISYQEEPFPAFTPGEYTKSIPFYTVTEENMVRVDSSIYIPEPLTPSLPATVDATYEDTHLYTYPFYVDPDGTGPAPEAMVYAADCFEFSDGDTIIVPVEIKGEARFQGVMAIRDYVKVNGDAAIQGNVAVEHYVEITGNATIQGNATVTSFIDTTGSVTITENARFLYGTNVGVEGNGITISSASVQIDTGLFHSPSSNININVANTMPFVGTFYALSGTSHFGGGCSIGTEDEPSYIITEGITTFVNLEGITLNGTVYSQGQIWIGNTDNTITADRNTGVALILDRAAVGGSGSTITTKTTNDTITGLIYARGVGSGINLNNDTVTGAVVCDGTVQYTGTVFHYFDEESFEKFPQVYRNFKAGRRRYVPVPGSLEVVW
jgi:Tfp pilus assembly protein PilE/cytoskeletal protein CcmA (bactofilin family)